jgi:hypothetical protein
MEATAVKATKRWLASAGVPAAARASGRAPSSSRLHTVPLGALLLLVHPGAAAVAGSMFWFCSRASMGRLVTTPVHTQYTHSTRGTHMVHRVHTASVLVETTCMNVTMSHQSCVVRQPWPFLGGI